MADVTTYGQAIDALIVALRAAWSANAPSVITPAPALIISGLDQDIYPTQASPPPNYARLYISHITGEQDTLGAVGERMYCRNGSVLVQVFCTNLAGEGYRKAIDLAEIAKDAFEGVTVENIWFRNATLREVGPIASFYQCNALVEFEWRHIR